MRLEIYLIEDNPIRGRAIEEYFLGVNSILQGRREAYAYKGSEKVFQRWGYDEVVFQYILPDTGGSMDEHLNYEYSENAGFVQEIKRILNRQENRIFLLDLALNKEERDAFGADGFYAETARNIILLLEESPRPETVVIESIYENIYSQYRRVLGLVQNPKSKIIARPGDVFATRVSERLKVRNISGIFEDIWNGGAVEV